MTPNEDQGDREPHPGDREFFRVRASIPVSIAAVEPSRYGVLAAEILSAVDPPLPEVDPALIVWLDRIETKLDRLLSHHGLSEVQVISESAARTLEMSGSGLRFVAPDGYEVGQALLLEFELPETRTRRVRALARVVDTASAAEASGQEAGVAFETIRQADRDAVVRYTLTVQRQTIRGGSSGEREG